MNAATNQVSWGDGKRPRKSALRRLAVLVSKTYKEPRGIPTPAQTAEMRRLLVEVQELAEYRRTHPNWRQEGR